MVKETTTKKKTVKKKVVPKEKKVPKEKVVVEEKVVPKKKEGEYSETIGRRKSAVARVRVYTQGKKEFLINDKKMEEYFPTFELRELCSSALKKMKCLDKFRITVKVSGGGINAQAEAIRHGISRALFIFNPDFKKRLRRVGFLTRDPRKRERKKFGLKRARRAPQWKKR
jgi:small subunit ribosomal protein S9